MQFVQKATESNSKLPVEERLPQQGQASALFKMSLIRWGHIPRVCVGTRAAMVVVENSYHGLALKSHLIGVFPQVNKKGDIFSLCLHWNAKNRSAEVSKMSRRNNFHHILCQLLYLALTLLWETQKGHLHVWLILCQHLAVDQSHISVIKNK